VSDVYITSSVPALFFHASPSAIEGPSFFDAFFAFSARVMAIVVYSVYGFVCSWTHVVKELLKRTPSFANLYASTAIVAVSVMGLGVATRTHFIPCKIFFFMGFSVFLSALGRAEHLRVPSFCVSFVKAKELFAAFLAYLGSACPVPKMYAYALGRAEFGSRPFLSTSTVRHKKFFFAYFANLGFDKIRVRHDRSSDKDGFVKGRISAPTLSRLAYYTERQKQCLA